MSDSPFEFAAGTVRIGDGPPIDALSFAVTGKQPASFAGFNLGELVFTAELTGSLSEQTLAKYRPSAAPRYDCTYAYPDGETRPCPVCREPAAAVVQEGVQILGGSTPESRADGSVVYSLAMLDPVACRCEPCGHRFDRDGKEIAS